MRHANTRISFSVTSSSLWKPRQAHRVRRKSFGAIHNRDRHRKINKENRIYWSIKLCVYFISILLLLRLILLFSSSSCFLFFYYYYFLFVAECFISIFLIVCLLMIFLHVWKQGVPILPAHCQYIEYIFAFLLVLLRFFWAASLVGLDICAFIFFTW